LHNQVEKPNREGLVELAAEADVVFYSRSWAEVSFGSGLSPAGGRGGV
jgi:ketohexokinase